MQTSTTGRPSHSDEESGALTYQVYAPESLPPPRPANLSRMSLPEIAPQPRLAARLGVALVAAAVVIATAALVAFGTAEEPHAKRAANATSTATSTPTALITAPAATATSPAVDPALSPAVEPSDPLSAAVPAAATETAATAAVTGATTSVKTKAPKTKVATPSTALRGVALPPNPFSGGAGGTPPTKPAKKK